MASWIEEVGDLGDCRPGDVAHRVDEKLRGRELVRVWEDGGAVVGFAICGRFGTAFDVFVALAAPDGQVAAFTVIWLDDRNRCALFEPVGTHPAFQRRGLARALMLHGLRVMAAAGMTRAVVEHDATNRRRRRSTAVSASPSSTRRSATGADRNS